jgi:DNA-binding beta-propeller fold protein YncE
VGIDLGPLNEIYVADTWNRRVQVFTSDGISVREWPVEGWDGPMVEEKPYLAVDANGYVYVTDPTNYRVLVFDAQGNYVLSFGKYGLDESSFTLPTGIAVAEDGTIYVGDAYSGRIMVFDPLNLEGAGVTELGSPSLRYPADGEKVASGTVPLLGVGAPGTTVQILVDAASVGTAQVDEQGFWHASVDLTELGEHAISLQTVEAQGVTLSSTPIHVIVVEQEEGSPH